MGTVLTWVLAEKYPKDVDAVVHTSPIGKGEFNSSVMRNLLPVQLVDPEKFEQLPLTYLTFRSAVVRERTF